MKKPLSYQIHKFIFDEAFFDDVYKKSPNLIKNDPSLLFKSIHVENPAAFLWLVKKVDIAPFFRNLFYFIIKEKRFLAYYTILKKSYPEVFNDIDNKRIIFKALSRDISWMNDDIKVRRLKIVLELAENNNFINSHNLDSLIKEKALHSFVIEKIKSGIMPIHKDNFFANFCRYGNSKHVPFFKELGCDIHYMNDLALINASEYKNEEMARYLIEKEGSNPFVGNNFPLFALFGEDEISEKPGISDEMIHFLAEYVYKTKKLSKSAFLILSKNKKFKIYYHYLTTKYALAENGKEKTLRVNKI